MVMMVQLRSHPSFSKLFAQKEASKEAPKISPLLEDIDHVLADCKSSEEAGTLMRSMINDLFVEVASLKERLKETGQELEDVRREKESWKNMSRENVGRLIKAIETKVDEPIKATKDSIKSSEQATELVVRALTRKIENMNIMNTQLVTQNQDLYDRIQAVEGENEARLHKIEALETQFKSINKTRQKVVSKLVDRTNTMSKQ